MERIKIIAIAIIIVAIAAYPAYVEIGIMTRQTQPPCPTCNLEQPVIDIIIPGLFSSQTHSDSILNVSAGKNATLEVDLYSQINANFTMKFDVYSPSNAASEITATFNPKTLTAQIDIKEITYVTINAASMASGYYYSTLSAYDDANSSVFQGVLVTIHVS